MKRLSDTFSAHGNAVLFSLLIMVSAVSITLAATSIVAKEVGNAALVPPAEQAYYKAESHIEQGLANKKYNPNYSIKDKNDLNTSADPYAGSPVVCATDPCFVNKPTYQTDLLTEFSATTANISPSNLALNSDSVVQFDVDSSAVVGGQRATLTINLPAYPSGVKGLEVTIVAFPNFRANVAGTCGTVDNYCGAAQQNNPSGDGQTTQTTPVLIDKVLYTNAGSKAISLGSSVTSEVTDEPYPELQGHTYRIRLKSLGGTIPGVSMKATLDVNGTPLKLMSSDFTVQAVAQSGDTRRGIRVVMPASGVAGSLFDYVLFSELGIDKTQAKKPPENPPPPPPLPQPQLVPLYRLYQPTVVNHFYTTNKDEWDQSKDLIGGQDGYTQENIAGYVSSIRLPGMIPLQRSWSPTYTDHYYQIGPPADWAFQRTEGYVYPGADPCPAGTAPLYETYNAPTPSNVWSDHFYTMDKPESDNSIVLGYEPGSQNVAACIWTNP